MSGIKLGEDTYVEGTQPVSSKKLSNEDVYRAFLEKLRMTTSTALGPGVTTITVQPWGKIEVEFRGYKEKVVNIIAPLELWQAKKQLFQNKEFMAAIRDYVDEKPMALAGVLA